MNSTPTWLCMEWPSVLRPDVLAREEHHGGGVPSLGAQHRGRAVRGGARDDGRAPGDRLRGVGSRRGDAAAAEHAAGDAATRGSVRASRPRRRARGCVGRVRGRDSGVDEYTCAQCVYFKTKQLDNSMNYSSQSSSPRARASRAYEFRRGKKLGDFRSQLLATRRLATRRRVFVVGQGRLLFSRSRRRARATSSVCASTPPARASLRRRRSRP